MHLQPNDFPLLVLPMQLVLHHGRLFISGLTKEGKLVNFAIDKDTHFQLTNKDFNRKKLEASFKKQMKILFGISEPINNEVYPVQIEFTAAFAQSWKRYFWHASQRWEALENGNCMLHLHCSIGRELIGFLAFGLDKVKVHQPQLLKELFQKKIQQTAAIYEQDLAINEEEANKDY